jgi:hypothetical protein
VADFDEWFDGRWRKCFGRDQERCSYQLEIGVSGLEKAAVGRRTCLLSPEQCEDVECPAILVHVVSVLQRVGRLPSLERLRAGKGA